MTEADEYWETLALRLEEAVKRRVERALPRGALRDLQLTVSIEEDEGGGVSLTVEADLQAHPGVKKDVNAVVEKAIAEAFSEVEGELLKRGLKPVAEGGDRGRGAGSR